LQEILPDHCLREEDDRLLLHLLFPRSYFLPLAFLLEPARNLTLP